MKQKIVICGLIDICYCFMGKNSIMTFGYTIYSIQNNYFLHRPIIFYFKQPFIYPYQSHQTLKAILANLSIPNLIKHEHHLCFGTFIMKQHHMERYVCTPYFFFHLFTLFILLDLFSKEER